MTATSDCWLIGGPAHDLSFHLWRRGYDVWLWNARGNMYSTEHVNMTYDQEKFFLFSLTELGIYDTTASIDYILNVTGHKNVITIGHSMGTTNVLIAASTRPEYQAKIALSILYAQGVFLTHVPGKELGEANYSQYVRWWNHDHLQRMLEKGSIYNNLLEAICETDAHPFLNDVCLFSMALVSGLASTQTQKDSVMRMMTKFPAGTSLNVIKQQVNNQREGGFRPLTYGRKKNLQLYGTTMPQDYPIGKVKIPTAIYYGCCNDFLSSPKDAKQLKNKLTNVVKYYSVPDKMFNHGDFLWAKDGYKLLYRDTILLIDEYTPAPYRSKKMPNID
uniref:Lipase 1 n=1 Tax=Cacopsylla melanoneura TaxID=428564 RepID=A0A8D8W6P4_9HEMI